MKVLLAGLMDYGILWWLKARMWLGGSERVTGFGAMDYGIFW